MPDTGQYTYRVPATRLTLVRAPTGYLQHAWHWPVHLQGTCNLPDTTQGTCNMQMKQKHKDTYKHVLQDSLGEPQIEKDRNEQRTEWLWAKLQIQKIFNQRIWMKPITQSADMNEAHYPISGYEWSPLPNQNERGISASIVTLRPVQIESDARNGLPHPPSK